MGLVPDLVSQLLKEEKLAPSGDKRSRLEAILLAGILGFSGGGAVVGSSRSDRIAAALEKTSEQVKGLKEAMAGATAKDQDHDRRLSVLEGELVRRARTK